MGPRRQAWRFAFLPLDIHDIHLDFDFSWTKSNSTVFLNFRCPLLTNDAKVTGPTQITYGPYRTTDSITDTTHLRTLHTYGHYTITDHTLLDTPNYGHYLRITDIRGTI